MRFLPIATCIFSFLILSGCGQIGIFTANIPSHFSKTVRHENIIFDRSHDLKLDIYTPSEPRNNDVVVFFYGGRWTYGTKDQYRFVGSALAEQGFVVVIPDYRKYPDVKFPDFVNDAARAVAWTNDHISGYGGNVERINLAGHSSGAHLAALVSTDPAYLKEFGKDPHQIIHSFVGLAGPYDFTPQEKDLVDMFGPEEMYPVMRPVTFAGGKTPPSLLLHGAEDTIVDRSNYENFEKKILQAGGCASSKLYDGIDHIWIVGAISWLGNEKASVLEDMVSFFKKPVC